MWYRLPRHIELANVSRFEHWCSDAPLAHRAEYVWLVGMGILAGGLTAWLEFNLRVPGHAILRGAIPVALGLALVPRFQSGTVIGAGALMGMMLATACGASFPGTGSMTSVTLLGPALDLTLRQVRGGAWRVYGAFALAGGLSNLVALLVRATQRFSGLDTFHANSALSWLAQALITYSLCGIAAGLLSATIGFRCGFLARAPRGNHP